jgi:hypothetical protein
MVVLNIEITLLMQQMIVEMQLIKKTVRITRQYDMTKPIITSAADYSLVGCNTAWPTTSKCTCGPTTVVLEELNLEI